MLYEYILDIHSVKVYIACLMPSSRLEIHLLMHAYHSIICLYVNYHRRSNPTGMAFMFTLSKANNTYTQKKNV